MKYVRTKDGRIVKLGEATDGGYAAGWVEIRNITHSVETIAPFEIFKHTDTIPELCDEFVFIGQDGIPILLDTVQACLDRIEDLKLTNYQIYGAIWTDKGLIYIAKMNEKGELELL